MSTMTMDIKRVDTSVDVIIVDTSMSTVLDDDDADDVEL